MTKQSFVPGRFMPSVEKRQAISNSVKRLCPMFKYLSCIFLVCLFCNVDAQKPKKVRYGYTYEFHLKPQHSVYTVDTIKRTAIADKSHIQFAVTDMSGGFLTTCNVKWLPVGKTNQNSTDTLSHNLNYNLFYNGWAFKSEIDVLPVLSSLQVTSYPMGILLVDSFLPATDFDYRFNIKLGRSNHDALGDIKCKHPLLPADLEQLIDDMSQERKNNLLETKECFVTWWI